MRTRWGEGVQKSKNVADDIWTCPLRIFQANFFDLKEREPLSPQQYISFLEFNSLPLWSERWRRRRQRHTRLARLILASLYAPNFCTHLASCCVKVNFCDFSLKKNMKSVVKSVEKVPKLMSHKTYVIITYRVHQPPRYSIRICGY